MGEIRLLHADDSRETACKIAARLAEEGHSVIRRDTGALVAAAAPDDAGADAVLVIWSPKVSAGSPLLDGARRALARRVLAPISVGGAEPPKSFAHLWPIDLDGWGGDTADPRWQFVRDEIDLARRRTEQREGPAPAAAAGPRRAPRAERLIAPVAAGLAITAAAIVIELTPPADAAPGAEPPMIAHLAVEPGSVALRDPEISAEPAVEEPVEASSTVFVAQADLPDAEDASAIVELSEETPSNAAAVAGGEAPVADEERVAELASVTPDNASADVSPAAPLIEEAPDPVAAGASPAMAETAPETPVEEAASGAPQEDAGVEVAETADTAVDDAQPALEAEAEAAMADEADILVAESAPIPPAAADTYGGLVFRDCSDCPDMVEIPAGVAPAATDDGVTRINPSPFAMARREVTFAEWDACVAAGGCRAFRPADGGWGRGDQPVVNVSRADAESYAEWLSRTTGHAYRLPSEAEWEYAALGGGSDPRVDGRAVTPSLANYEASLLARPAPGARFSPSAYGLYDMLGNVWEWTGDCADAAPTACSQAVAKGGAYNSSAWRLTAAHRLAKPAGAREPDIGFRIARSLP